MAGFLDIRMRAWQRRLLTRACAIVPAVLVIGLTGDHDTGRLLVISQVILSLGLPFAIVPLMIVGSDRVRMGPLVLGPWMRALGWGSVAAVVVANAGLVLAMVRSGG
jgi:manganese transport protein